MTQLFFACDVSDLGLGRTLIQKTAPYVDAIKIGLEAMTSEDSQGVTLASQLRREAGSFDKHVMWDMKLHDVTNTMRAAGRNIVALGATYFTLHASASDEALEAVAQMSSGIAIPLAVTVLTDLDEPQCLLRYGLKPSVAVVQFAKNARSRGIAGFVCSPLEVQRIRDAVPDAFIVTPGIRPEWSVDKDEQKRVTTPTQAKRAGASAIVVGRPIYKPPRRYQESTAAELIKQELEAA